MYELTYIIAPETTEEEIAGVRAKINSFLKERGAELKKEQAPRKIKLGVPVKKKGSAYLASVSFLLSPEKMPELPKGLSGFGEILRFFCAAQKESAEKLPWVKARKDGRRGGGSVNKKVELKEIEEKLEEILGK